MKSRFLTYPFFKSWGPPLYEEFEELISCLQIKTKLFNFRRRNQTYAFFFSKKDQYSQTEYYLYYNQGCGVGWKKFRLLNFQKSDSDSNSSIFKLYDSHSSPPKTSNSGDSDSFYINLSRKKSDSESSIFKGPTPTQFSNCTTPTLHLQKRPTPATPTPFTLIWIEKSQTPTPQFSKVRLRLLNFQKIRPRLNFQTVRLRLLTSKNVRLQRLRLLLH